MKIKKTFTVFCGLMIGILFLVGCGKSTANKPAKNDTKTQIYIPIVSKGWQHQYWQSVKMGANKAAKDYNVRITFEGPEGDAAINKQIEMIDLALSKKPAALILAACDTKSVIPELERSKSLNIPVIGFDSGVDSNIPITTVATNNEAAASTAADKLALAIGQKGEIAIICHDGVSTTGIGRRDGFLNRIKEKYPKIEVVDVKYSMAINLTGPLNVNSKGF